MRMRFAREFGDTGSIDTGSTSILYDSDLAYGNDYWNGAWVYIIGTPDGEVRKINDFSNAGSILPEIPFSAVPNGTYEIHDRVNALDINDAINDAIRDGWKHFFDYVMSDTELILKEDTLEYSLTGLTKLPWKVYKVWIENSTTTIRGTADSATSTTLVDSDADFSGVVAGWYLSIYDGTGAGQIRTVSSVASSTITVPDWDTTPDTTSKYALWDPLDQEVDWTRITAVRFDANEFPNTMYFTREYHSHLGQRIRVQYTSQPGTLSADSDTTILPQEYIVNKAMSILFDTLVNSNRADRQRYAALAEYHDQLARDIRERKAFQPPSRTLWQEEDTRPITGVANIHGDPLGWRRR